MITVGDVDGNKLQTVLKQLLAEHTIYRAKGFASLPGKSLRQVLQAVGQRLDVHFDRFWSADEQPETSLVFIGKNLDETVLKSALQTAELPTAA